MADIVLQHNIGAYVTPRSLMPATGAYTQTAGATSAVTSPTIDRLAFGSSSPPGSAVFTVNYATNLTAAKTLSLTMEVDSSPDGTTWTAYATKPITLVASATGTQVGQLDFAVDLFTAQRYLRLITTPTLSNTGTDTVNIAPTAVFAGFDRLAAGV